MIFIFKPIVCVFLVGMAISLIVGIVVWKRRPAPGAWPFAIFNFASLLWSFTWMLELGAVELEDKIICAKIEYIGILASGVFWLFFALDYAGYKWWRRPRNFMLVSAIPIVCLGIVWTNEWHGWFWSHIYFTSLPMVRTTIWEHGWAFTVSTIYQYLLIFSGVVILWRFSSRRSRNFRRQVIALTASVMMTVFFNLLYLANIDSIKGLDFTPLSLSFSGLIFLLSIFRYHLLDVSAVAINTLVESLPDGLVALNNQGEIVDMNPAAEKLAGFPKSAALGKPLGATWPVLHQISVRMGFGQHQELITEYPGGKNYWDTSLTPLYDNQGELGGELIVIRDVTERRRIEQKMQESEARYSTLVEQSHDGVLLIQDGKFIFANNTMLKITGYLKEEFIGRSLPFPISAEDSDIVLRRYRLRKQGQAVPNNYDVRMNCKDGRALDVEINVGMITIQGIPTEMVTLRDVTERKVSQRKLESLYQEECHLRQELQEEIDNRSKYTRSLVHELKTPLTAILSSTELLETEVRDPVLSGVVKNISQASYHLERRTNELIDLACGEIGILKVESEPLDMAEIIRKVITKMTPLASRKGLTLVKETSELPLVVGDHKRLQMVLSNIIHNAIKYTDRGEVTVRAKDYDSSNLLIQIQDNGQGIQQDQMSHLFDPYRRKTTEGQKYGGIGVGLAVSRMYIELQKGKIWVESTPGRGTTVNFTLPLYKEPGMSGRSGAISNISRQ